MIQRPRFQHHFHIEVVEPETVFLLSERHNFMLRGRLYKLLVPWLNGCHTTEKIIDRLQGQASTAEINYALLLLQQKGYITEVDGTTPPEVAAFWNLLGVETREVAIRLKEKKVTITSIGTVPADPLVDILDSLDIRTGQEGAVGIVLTDDYLRPELDAYNQAALESNRPWLLVKPVGAVLSLGPLFLPGQTGCWACLAQRLAGNREVETFIQSRSPEATRCLTSRSVLPSTQQTGLNMAATAIAQWIACGAHPHLEGTVVTLDTTTMVSQRHILTRRPQCPQCGDPAGLSNQKPHPLSLTSQHKAFTGGGYRVCRPEQTLDKYGHHVSPITGVVSELRRTVEADNELLHVYLAAHYLPSADLGQLRSALRNKSAGKGWTDLQARVSGLCEAIERYSVIHAGDEYRIKARYAELGESAVHPQAILHFSQTQYQHRLEWNQRADPSQWVPDPFDEAKEIEWVCAWSLTEQTFKYVPLAYCYYGYPLPPGHQFCRADSNGSAAGNTIEEAILQGFLELVERDSVAVWWYNRLSRPGVDLDSFDEPYLRALGNYYQTLDRELWALDITNDLEIPAFAAVSRYTGQANEDIILGYGAHLDPKIALLRAITEVNQKLAAPQVAERAKGATDPNNWEASATLLNQPYLKPSEDVAPRQYADYPRMWNDDLRDDVELCVEVAARRGLETLILDQTRPDIGLPVVKAIVPGLRHFYPRFAPGRLYDVPVALGWLKAPLAETQLNPFPKPS